MVETGVHITGLDLDRGGRSVLADLELEVEAGGVTALVGPSGSGKSTVLRCVNRLLEPPRGAVFLGDTDVTDLEVVELRRRVGMVFQRPVGLPGTVADNLRFGPRLAAEDLDDEVVSELLAAVTLPTDYAHRPATDLSGGELQRLALARCLANHPDVILLDEPTSALDPAARLAVARTVGDVVCDSGTTVLWVTHDLAEARSHADTLVLLGGGRVVAAGPTEELLDDADGPVARFARGEAERGGEVPGE